MFLLRFPTFNRKLLLAHSCKGRRDGCAGRLPRKGGSNHSLPNKELAIPFYGMVVSIPFFLKRKQTSFLFKKKDGRVFWKRLLLLLLPMPKEAASFLMKEAAIPSFEGGMSFFFLQQKHAAYALCSEGGWHLCFIKGKWCSLLFRKDRACPSIHSFKGKK